MNSSGIKRGLAATAVAALAVTGLPFLASSASAVVGDTITQIAGGPVRDKNAAGGQLVIKSATNTLDVNNMYVTNVDFTNDSKTKVGSVGHELSSAAFDLDVLSVKLLDGDTTNNGGADDGDKFPDGTYHYGVQTAVTLGTATTATFGLVEDTLNDGVNAGDPKVKLEVTPAGAPASIDISSSLPATAGGIATPFDVQVKDSKGNLTQLVSGETVGIGATATTTSISDASLDHTAAELGNGKATVTVTWATTAGNEGGKVVTATGAGGAVAGLTDSASIQVYANATVAKGDFGITTGADTWKDGVTAFGTATQVRVDQNSVTFNVDTGKAADAGKVVAIMLYGADGIKFNGQAGTASAPASAPIQLDANGKGSVTVALSNVTTNAKFSFAAPGSSIGATEITMAKPAPQTPEADSAVYSSKIGAATTVTVHVEDQFGNAIGAPAQVAIKRGTRNGGTLTDRVTVNASGDAVFTLPDAGTTAGSETFTIRLYQDQFDGNTTDIAGGTINYTADGLGGDFTVSSASPTITPLYDSNTAVGTGDYATISIASGTTGATAKVSVDNGALVLSDAGTPETTLAQGSATDTVTLAGGGSGTFRVVGTKTGPVTVTVVSGGRTKTITVNVAQPAAGAGRVATARNVEVTAPEQAVAGEVAVFTVKVTDAFGNPVSGVPASALNLQASGPGNVQGTAAATTDANGEIGVNVILSDNADSAVTVRVTGVVDNNAPSVTQFGDAANVVDGVAAPGVAASENTDNATVTDVVNLEALEQAVADAQDKVDNAQDNVDAAKGDLAVAKAERSVAQKAVKSAKKDLRQAKKHHKGVKAARKALREARGDKRIANAKVSVAQAKVNTANERLADAQAELEAAQQALEDAQK